MWEMDKAQFVKNLSSAASLTTVESKYLAQAMIRLDLK